MAAQPDHIDPHEQRVAALLADVRTQVRAPDALRTRVDAERQSRRPSRRAGRRPGAQLQGRRRPLYGGTLATGLAVLALALVLLLPGGTPGAPSLSQAASIGALGPTSAAPAADREDPSHKLDRSVEKVYFPNWSAVHWHATGQRLDRLGGRVARTVFYRWGARTIAYTIVGAPALTAPRATVHVLGGVTFKTLVQAGRVVVTWQRAGHTCILSATDVAAAVMQRLAASGAQG